MSSSDKTGYPVQAPVIGDVHHDKTASASNAEEVCPECNGSLYISCFTIDGIKIRGCEVCKGTGKIRAING